MLGELSYDLLCWMVYACVAFVYACICKHWVCLLLRMCLYFGCIFVAEVVVLRACVFDCVCMCMCAFMHVSKSCVPVYECVCRCMVVRYCVLCAVRVLAGMFRCFVFEMYFITELLYCFTRRFS